ncbi:putative 2-dehydropantoate 2-reductase [Aspergillus saccharolyticus JOP 1030-1]|uniref:Putative 2-dehydropantoate 2-reductase n=1 Tax=Aspergillus saccharolyticus JOP 1030-1 TaxID=1450539 RepID=A0A318ZM64_9EURO|nr:putative 2-dehydropantoate 2-reductase [Aspergillus saccharolyticus JOP 1030-1]PYH44950.1 putative 2-dehydropantoate 2-reductase [Aspergillus saccharolyticus JOP 1030-1]
MLTWFSQAKGASGNKRQLSGRIHILGLENTSLFVAHSLASRPSVPPITLLLPNTVAYESWLNHRKCISLQTNSLEDKKTGFDVEVMDNGTWYSFPYDAAEEANPFKQEPDDKLDTQNNSELESDFYAIAADTELNELSYSEVNESNREIECLIIATGANMTTLAVHDVKHRLTPDSTILLLSSGLGLRDEINANVFPDPEERPHYMEGVVSHNITRRQRGYQIKHLDVGTTVLGVPLQDSQSQPKTEDLYWRQNWAPTTKYLMHILTSTPPLVATAAAPTDLMLHQLEKVAIQSVLEPVTALMEIRNGDVLYNPGFSRIMRLLLLETCSIFAALPEVRSVPGIEARFSPERLRRMVVQQAARTFDQDSRMLKAVRNRWTTEIRYLNNYIVRRGEKLGLKPVMNYLIMSLIEGKAYQIKQQEAAAIPIDFEPTNSDGLKADNKPKPQFPDFPK